MQWTGAAADVVTSSMDAVIGVWKAGMASLALVPQHAWPALAAVMGLLITSWWRRHDDLNKLLAEVTVAINRRAYWLHRVAWLHDEPTAYMTTLSREAQESLAAETWQRYYDAIHHWNEQLGWYYVQLHRLMGRRFALTIVDRRKTGRSKDTVYEWFSTAHRELSDYARLTDRTPEHAAYMEAALRDLESRIDAWQSRLAAAATPIIRRNWRRVRSGTRRARAHVFSRSGDRP